MHLARRGTVGGKGEPDGAPVRTGGKKEKPAAQPAGMVPMVPMAVALVWSAGVLDRS